MPFDSPHTHTDTVSDVPPSRIINRSILFIPTTAQWGIKGQENGVGLLKNIYTL